MPLRTTGGAHSIAASASNGNGALADRSSSRSSRSRPIASPNPAPWPLTYGAELQLAVPLRSSRRLVGDGSPAPACGRRPGSADAPCPRETIGDHLQWAIQVSDGQQSPILTPFVGIFVQTGPPSGDAPAIIASAPARVSIAALARGLTVRLRPPSAAARMTSRLLDHAGTLTYQTRRAHGTAPLTMRLVPTRATLRTLAHSRHRQLEIDASAEADGNPPLSARRLVVLHGS